MAALWDPVTTDVLSRISLEPQWCCLEVGAGTGSIARWVAERCPDGHVTATDIDLRFLPEDELPANVDVLFHDVVEGPEFAPAAFDLIHCRAVLAHLPDRDRVISRISGWLAPGGRLLVEEPCLFPVESSPDPLFRRFVEAHAMVLERWIGTDLHWARGLPSVLTDAGLAYAGMTAHVMAVGDGGPGETFWQVSLEQLGPTMVSAGLLTAPELDEMRRALSGSRIRDLSWALVSVWARKP